MFNHEYSLVPTTSVSAPSYFEFYTQLNAEQEAKRAKVLTTSEQEPDTLDFTFADTYEVLELTAVTP